MKFTERHTSSGRPRLRFIESPRNGPTLLMLHGVTRRAEDFQPLWEALVPHHHIISIDQRGHGGSERAASYFVGDFVADAVALLRDELAEPVVVHGHSLGAMIAASLAAELPALVRGIVLEDPPFYSMGRNILGTAWQAQFIATRDAAIRGGSVEELTDALADIRLPQPDGGFKRLGDLRDRAALRWSADCLSRIDPQILTPVVEGRWLDGYDIPDTLSRLHCPTLLLHADLRMGGALTDADAQLCLDSVAGCRRVRFPGQGHLLHWLVPGEIAELVKEFARLSR